MEPDSAKPIPQRRATIDGVTTVAPVERSWETWWKKFSTVANPLAAVGVLFASVIFGITTWAQQDTHANAVVMADRQDTALTAVADAFTVHDRATRLIIAIDAAHVGATQGREPVAAKGQEMETAAEIAISSLMAAATKATGYRAHDELIAAKEAVAQSQLVVAVFLQWVLYPFGDVSEARYQSERQNALEALDALLIALNNAAGVSACDFGYRNEAGAAGFQNCPNEPLPVPEIELTPEMARGDLATH